MSQEEIRELKEKIALEERLRNEIRDENKQSPWLSFLNSSFGLWVLSAIFISWSGNVYNNWVKEQDKEKIKLEQKLKQESKDKESIEKLDTEIAYRISKSLTRLDSINHAVRFGKYPKDRYESSYVFAVNASFDVLSQMAKYPPKTFPPLYSEYKESSLPMLISELYRKTKMKEDQSELNVVLSKLLAVSSSYDFEGQKNKTPQEITAGMINSDFLLERWKSHPFKYLQCKAEQPLC